MKLTDPDIELVACGSSYYTIPTFGEWELTVLDHTYDLVDYISLHQYYWNWPENAADFLGRSVYMDSFIKDVVALCDAVKAKKHSGKKMMLAFDEWNVWYHSNGAQVEPWQIAPPLLEDIYNFEDALVVGSCPMTLQNNCDRVKIACLAQLVNAIAPIMTETGGRAWAQTTFYPYMYASRYGRGRALEVKKICDSYRTSYDMDIPYVESSVIWNEEKREVVVFAVNRSLDEEMELTLELEGFDTAVIEEHVELYSDDLKEVNTKDDQNVCPVNREVVRRRSVCQQIQLKKHSWNMIRLNY